MIMGYGRILQAKTDPNIMPLKLTIQSPHNNILDA